MTTAIQDEEQLRLLSIFHWVVAGMTALSACFPLLHLAIGVAMIGQDPPWLGWFLVALAGFAIAVGWTLAICLAIAARSIAERRKRTFCLVVAGAACLFFPIGTALGIFAIFVLSKESVRDRFDARSARATARWGT